MSYLVWINRGVKGKFFFLYFREDSICFFIYFIVLLLRCDILLEILFGDIIVRLFSYVNWIKCLFISFNKKYVLSVKWLVLGKDICVSIVFFFFESV